MVSKDFEFLFDVAGPNAFLTHRVLPAFCRTHGVTARYVPILLGGVMKATGNRPPWAVYADVPAKVAYDQLEFRRFISKHGLTAFRMNSHFPINSIVMMRMLAGLQDQPDFAPVMESLFIGMWEADRNLGDADALSAWLSERGHDAAALIALAGDDASKARLIANSDDAVRRGAFGVPTFFVGDEIFFGKERLGQVAEALQSAPDPA